MIIDPSVLWAVRKRQDQCCLELLKGAERIWLRRREERIAASHPPPTALKRVLFSQFFFIHLIFQNLTPLSGQYFT